MLRLLLPSLSSAECSLEAEEVEDVISRTSIGVVPAMLGAL